MPEWIKSTTTIGDRDPKEVIIFDVSVAEVEHEGKKRMVYITSWSDNFIETVLKKYTPERLAAFEADMIAMFKDSIKRELEPPQ